MKAIVNTQKGVLEMQEVPTVEPAPGQVRIRTSACGICITDFTMIDGSQRSHYPAILGHEWSGTVDAVGEDVDPELAGAFCVAENVLSDGREVGFEHPGGYGEYLLTEAQNIHILPSDFDAGIAALVEPLAVCVRGVSRVGTCNTEAAVIFGDGPIGLLMLVLLRYHGFERMLLVGGRTSRLQLAAKLGAEQTVNYHETNVPLAGEIERRGYKRVPTVIDASGTASAVEAGLHVVGASGRVLLVGDYQGEQISMPLGSFLLNELALIASNASAGAWSEATRLAISAELPLDRLITHRFAAADFASAVSIVRDRRADVVKAVLEWT